MPALQPDADYVYTTRSGIALVEKPGGSNRAFARVSVITITNGNKAPGGFSNPVFGTKYSLSEIKTQAPACFESPSKKAAPPFGEGLISILQSTITCWGVVLSWCRRCVPQEEGEGEGASKATRKLLFASNFRRF